MNLKGVRDGSGGEVERRLKGCEAAGGVEGDSAREKFQLARGHTRKRTSPSGPMHCPGLIHRRL